MAAITLPVLEHTGLGAFSPEPVSLAALKAANHVLEWYEGVAIVQELYRALCDPRAEAGSRDLDDTSVTIDMSGRVVTTARRLHDGSEGVRALAELLRGMLSDDVPVALRLALSQAHTSPPFYTSLSEFSRALQYFERPNRSAIIQGAYRRWEQLEPERSKSKQEEPDTEEPKRELPKRQPARAALPRRALLIASAVGVVLALGITGVLIVTNVIEVGGSPSANDPWRSAGTAAVEAVSSIASSVTDRINPPATPSSPDISTPSTPAATAAIRTEFRKPVTPEAPAVSFARIIETPKDLGHAEKIRVVAIDEQPVETAAAPAKPVVIDRAISTAIYSEVDADVVPPIAVYPQFPSPSEPKRQDAARFDIVINRAGHVESVKFRRAPASIADALVLTMSLSAAKAWRFQPAIRDGQAVRYRKAIWLPPVR
jgi:hypothetical protein